MSKIDVFAVGIVEIKTITVVGVALQIHDVVSDDDRFGRRTRDRTQTKHRSVIGGSGHIDDIVLEDTAITATEDVNGIIVITDIVCAVDGIATHSHMVGKGDVHRLAALVGESAILNQKTVIVLIDVMALIIQPYVTVHKSAIHKSVIAIQPFARNPIDEVFVVFKIG